MFLPVRNCRLLRRSHAGTCGGPTALVSDRHQRVGWTIGGWRIGTILVWRGNQLLQRRVKAGVYLLKRIGWCHGRRCRHNRMDALFAVGLWGSLLTNASTNAFTFKSGIHRIQNPIPKLPIGQQFFDEQADTADQEPYG